jgi:hypothetical protein
MSRLARPAVLIPLVIVLVLIGAGAWWWSQAQSSTPVSAQKAEQDYGGDATAGRVVPGGPRAGVWTYRASGDETVGAGPVSADRRLPGTARVVVRPAPGGFWRTLALSEEHVEASRLRSTPRGTLVVERVTTITVAGIGRDDRQMLVPPPLAYPRALEPGDSWVERYRMDEVRVLTRARVLRRDAVEVEGRRLPVLVIEKKGTVTGPIEGFRDDVQWWSVELDMPVRWSIATELDGFASLRMDAELVLESIAPAAPTT